MKKKSKSYTDQYKSAVMLVYRVANVPLRVFDGNTIESEFRFMYNVN